MPPPSSISKHLRRSRFIVKRSTWSSHEAHTHLHLKLNEHQNYAWRKRPEKSHQRYSYHMASIWHLPPISTTKLRDLSGEYHHQFRLGGTAAYEFWYDPKVLLSRT